MTTTTAMQTTNETRRALRTFFGKRRENANDHNDCNANHKRNSQNTKNVFLEREAKTQMTTTTDSTLSLSPLETLYGL
jgi:hypothetical protein